MGKAAVQVSPAELSRSKADESEREGVGSDLTATVVAQYNLILRRDEWRRRRFASGELEHMWNWRLAYLVEKLPTTIAPQGEAQRRTVEMLSSRNVAVFC